MLSFSSINNYFFSKAVEWSKPFSDDASFRRETVLEIYTDLMRQAGGTAEYEAKYLKSVLGTPGKP